MRTSIREQLKWHGVKPECSVYRTTADAALDFPLIIGDFIKICEEEGAMQIYPVFRKWRRLTEKKKQESEEYQTLQTAKEELFRQEAEWKRKQTLPGQVQQPSEEEKRQLRQRKKAVQGKQKELSERIAKEAWDDLGYGGKAPCALQYKNTVFLSTGAEIMKSIPCLSKISEKDTRKLPFFVSHLEELQDALGKGEEIGIVGGPCLFGMDEVLVHITLENGACAAFDCCCGRRCLKEQDADISLKEYIVGNRERIVQICFENRKTGITRQEYDSLRFLFAFAETLRAKTVIPLPDLSYLKYMESDLQELPAGIKESKLEEFRKEAYKITDLYLEVIGRMGKQHPNVEYTVLHERERGLCRKFCEKRKPYIEKSSYMQKITNADGKKESIIDYITMLALPWYFYGTKYVVQLDSVDETDSGRKCRKIHKGDMKLAQILYPEYLSGDGKNTIYHAAMEFKEYGG